ncbi:hypothetical protein Tco_1396891, partial [Tanacetum coccineum]
MEEDAAEDFDTMIRNTSPKVEEIILIFGKPRGMEMHHETAEQEEEKINFLLNTPEGNAPEDDLDHKTESRVEDKDRRAVGRVK